MPVFLQPLHESNQCHNPEGSPASTGGEFCSDAGAGGPDLGGPKGFARGVPPIARIAVRQLQKGLVGLSFAVDDIPHETMGFVDLRTGQRVGEILIGDEDSVGVPPTLQKQLAAHYPGPLMTAHTHPGAGGAFSWDDFWLHNEINRQAPPGTLAVDRMHVYTKDGTWYELKFSKVFDNNELASIHKLFDQELERAQDTAGRQTDQWAREQPWWADKPKNALATLWTERERINHVAEKAGQRDALEIRYRAHFRQASVRIWEQVAKRFPVTFRTYQAPGPN